MRARATKRREARAALALLVGLLVGGWAGGGLVWVLNRGKYRDSATVADVNLLKAEELDLVPADATGFAHARLTDLWRTDALAEFRKVVAKAGPDALKALDDGFAPAPSTVERATVVVLRGPAAGPTPPGARPAPRPKGPAPGGLTAPPPPPPAAQGSPGPHVLAVLAFSAPVDAAKVRRANFPAAVQKTAGGKDYWADARAGVAVHFPGDKLILIGTVPAVELYLSKPVATTGPLAAAIRLAAGGGRHILAAVNMEQVPSLRTLVPTLPGDIDPILRAESVTLGVVVGAGAKLDLRAAYRDEAAAQEAEKSVRSAATAARMKLGEAKAKAERAVQGNPGRPGPRPVPDLPEAVGGLFTLGAVNMLDEWLKDPPVTREGKDLATEVTVSSFGSVSAYTTAATLGLMTPAVQKVREAAARTADANNLKQLVIAMHNYENAYGRLPPAAWGAKDETGRPAGNLSWRVALLPYVGQAALYQQFRQDEPWDGPHNKRLISQMPKVFASPDAPAEPGKTYYKVFVGGGAVFDRGPRGSLPLPLISDGTSNTILIAEGGAPVVWTKPDDFAFDPKKPLPALALPGRTVVQVAMADGAVRSVDLGRVSEKTLRNAIQADDGQRLGPDW